MGNFELNSLPNRAEKPRQNGLTMVMDKGLAVREVENLIDAAAPYIDIVKLGWTTAHLAPNLDRKLQAYKDAGIPVYFGGTLFECFVVRNQFDEYCRTLDRYGIEHVEVSDGSIEMPHDEKCEYIVKLASNYRVLSEVGSKDAEKIIAPYKWIQMMKDELAAGSYKVIAESREAGNVGIFRGTGEVRSGLVDEILTQIDGDLIIWEAPQKAQQTYFIRLLGANVNLGNISPQEIIPCETLRLGVRSDTFSLFLENPKYPTAPTPVPRA